MPWRRRRSPRLTHPGPRRAPGSSRGPRSPLACVVKVHSHTSTAKVMAAWQDPAVSSWRVAMPRQCLSRLKQRSITLRRLARSGIVAPIPRRRRYARIVLAAVTLVGHHRTGARESSPRPWVRHPNLVQHRSQHRAVVDVAAGHHQRQRPPPPVTGQVNLGGQPAPGPPEPLAVAPPFDTSAALWCTRASLGSLRAKVPSARQYRTSVSRRSDLSRRPSRMSLLAHASQ